MQAGVKFVVFSTLETIPKDVKAKLPEIEAGYTVPHFESKARVQVRPVQHHAVTVMCTASPKVEHCRSLPCMFVLVLLCLAQRQGMYPRDSCRTPDCWICSQDYLKQSGIPYTCLLTSAFFDNFIGGIKLQKQGDAYCWGHNLGTAPHAWHAVGDIGGTAAGATPHATLQSMISILYCCRCKAISLLTSAKSCLKV